MRKQKGITLIALVITIIVLLILAGVSISMALGENGILTRAEDAVVESRVAEVEEKIQLSIAENEMAKYSKNKTKITKSGLVLELLSSNLLTQDEATLLETEDIIEIEGRAVDFTPLNENLVLKTAPEVTPDDYGKKVNLIIEGGKDEYIVFYADENNIYLISESVQTVHKNFDQLSEVAEIANYNGTADFENLDISKYPAIAAGWLNKTYDPNAAGTADDPYLKYENLNVNMKATQYLLDSSVWNSRFVTPYAKWVIASPTLELFAASYNDIEGTSVESVIEEELSIGYSGIDEIKFSKDAIHPLNFDDTYWFANPASSDTDLDTLRVWLNKDNLTVNSIEKEGYDQMLHCKPVICLKSDTALAGLPDENGYIETFSLTTK